MNKSFNSTAILIKHWPGRTQKQQNSNYNYTHGTQDYVDAAFLCVCVCVLAKYKASFNWKL